MTDASRAVDVVSQLLSPERQADISNPLPVDTRRSKATASVRASLTSLESARANALSLDFSAITKPDQTGVIELLDYPVDELVARIDWTPFLRTWEMPGKWPAISAETESGRQALQLVADAEEIIAELAAHPDSRLRPCAPCFQPTGMETTFSYAPRNERPCGHPSIPCASRFRGQRGGQALHWLTILLWSAP